MTTPALIHIADLRARCTLGVGAEERRAPQEVLINLWLHADLRAGAASDDLARTVDYRAIKRAVLRLAESSRFHLLEALVDRVAGLCLEDRRVLEVRVRIEKPSALRFARSVAIEMIVNREG